MARLSDEEMEKFLAKRLDLIVGCYFGDNQAIQRETLGEYLAMSILNLLPDDVMTWMSEKFKP